MTTSKKRYASLLGGLFLAVTLPSVQAHSVDYRDLHEKDPKLSLERCARQEHHDRNESRAKPQYWKQPGRQPMFTLDSDYDQVEFFKGKYTSITPFSILTAGKYELTLTDLSFPDALKNLGVAVTSSTEKLGQLFGTGSLIFDAQPGKYYLSLFASTFRPRELGLFGLSLQAYSPLPGTPSAVPAPGALWLFGSGLLGVTAIVRRRA